MTLTPVAYCFAIMGRYIPCYLYILRTLQHNLGILEFLHICLNLLNFGFLFGLMKPNSNANYKPKDQKILHSYYPIEKKLLRLNIEHQSEYIQLSVTTKLSAGVLTEHKTR